jgi:hypothetical protein
MYQINFTNLLALRDVLFAFPHNHKFSLAAGEIIGKYQRANSQAIGGTAALSLNE